MSNAVPGSRDSLAWIPALVSWSGESQDGIKSRSLWGRGGRHRSCGPRGGNYRAAPRTLDLASVWILKASVKVRADNNCDPVGWL